MADKRVHTYDPFPYGGEITNRNWFFADTLTDVAVRDRNKPGGYRKIFDKIADADFANERPSIAHGDYSFSKGFEQGTYFSMPESKDADYVMSAEEAAVAISGPVLSIDDGWTQEEKGFTVEWFGWYGSGGAWYQKWNWELYNSSKTNWLSLPVKGIAFTFRVPSEKGIQATNSKFDSGAYGHSTRGDQTGIDNIWGLWYHPESGKYYVFELEIWGNEHAPSIHKDLKDSVYYSPYWFGKRPQNETGGVTSGDKKMDHSSIIGQYVPIMAWANEKILEKCCFCGFAVQNETEKKATTSRPHTNQWGQLSPIPFHIDRSGDFRAVYGGSSITTDAVDGGDFRSIYMT